MRKIAEPMNRPCSHPQHKPPSMIVLKPGTYEHTCPACGQKTIVRVPQIWC